MKYEIKETGKRSTSPIISFDLSMNNDPTLAYQYKNEYRLEIRCTKIFSASKDDFTKAKEYAEKSLKYFMYGDIIRELDNICEATYAGKVNDIFLIVEKIKSHINEFGERKRGE